MENQLLPEVSLAIARGDVALWLGPQWKMPMAADADRIQSVDWLGVWIENQDAGLVNATTIGSHTQSGRLVIEVPDRIEDVLGKHFSVADVCPHFYLNGRGDGDGPLSPRQRRMARDEKVQQLARLKTSVLILAGYDDESTLAKHLEEVSEAAPECRLVVITGLEPNATERLVAGLHLDLPERMVGCEQLLPDLLLTVEKRRAALPATPSIRVGKQSIQLDRLLRTEPPLDQDFVILTEQDIRDPEPPDRPEALLIHLLRGTTPAWRAFAHQHEWQRPLPHRRDALKRLSEIRRGSQKVSCLNIPAESGAGLTTLLHQIAFDAARDGAPTLIHRPQGELNYDRLRSFLTDLHATVESRSAANEPSVIIFDGDSVRADSAGQLRTIAARMARDGRRALIIRGIPLRSVGAFNDEFTKLHASLRQGEVIEEAWMPLIPATLETAQQQSLLRWASSRLERIRKVMPTTAARVVESWGSQAGDVPLLIFLYSILSGELREAAGLGRHLVSQLLGYIREDKIQAGKPEPKSEEPLSGESLQAAVAQLQARWRRMPVASPPTSDEVSSVFITLAAMGCLRLGVTRSILADLASVHGSHVLEVLRRLEAWNLATTDILSLPTDDGGGGTLAPSAFYTREESVGLLHPSYGRLIFEWLGTPEAIEDRQFLAARGLTDRFLESFTHQDLQNGIPIRLLEPVFRSLRPIESHVRFAEDVAMRYLRLQKGRQQEELAKWQWKHFPVLLEVFTWLDEQVIRQSASLLHSRGITTYKSCRPNVELPEARIRYSAAERDFERAIELARSGGTDRPVNIMSSLGLLYLGWLKREREAGYHEEAAELDRKVEQTLRAALDETPEASPYAVYGLASYLVSRYERVASGGIAELPASAAADLAEAIELMQIEPEAYFEDEWNDLRRIAIEHLGDNAARLVIEQLKREKNELGYVLEALRILQGTIPDVPTAETQEVENIREAAAILRDAGDLELKSRNHLADLLRYALFSADPDRLTEPAYRQRYDLISRLIGSRYLDVPVWLYDYAMLCFQVGQHGEGADAYSRLRKGKRFFEVSRDRSCWLTENPDSLKPAQVFLRIISVEGPEGKAWGRVEHPRRLRDPIPLSVRSFRSRGKSIQVGYGVSCQISLNPAGPFAEPLGIKDV